MMKVTEKTDDYMLVEFNQNKLPEKYICHDTDGFKIERNNREFYTYFQCIEIGDIILESWVDDYSYSKCQHIYKENV